ncbi:MAG: hypothetical protein A3C90_00860 [Candidatus Magasanikbacteria bacterium RIFCSPHIGHO2_02_FULL_51_14]|uniref:MIP18 family-like domain-containing protein n=1 Tax=Candidatus Magasanikbacteria bacterium RIFCSPHIGHO2_02_FULL_51_14 TaxID=1798683 RepID=A0A1F6MQW1_9BACT|nr:MAG: hypothetical protein A3C90_00860 [Candidatus Magasanikbacteria bacterium RIFCSPHIGHO2_02_FULL_51_14]
MKAMAKEQILDRLKNVMDPEVACDIVTMGLVREVNIRDDGSVHIVYTLTSPMCPLGPQIEQDIRSELLSLGIDRVEIELTFDPPWREPEGLRAMMGLSI